MWARILTHLPTGFTKIFLAEIERLLSAAADVTIDAAAPAAARPRLGAISFLHRFGSALNHHVHLHACVTDGVFVPPAAGSANDAPPAFLAARPINLADLAAVTEQVRRRLIGRFRRMRLLDASAAADVIAWQNSGFSIDASVRIAFIDRDVPSYFQSLELPHGDHWIMVARGWRRGRCRRLVAFSAYYQWHLRNESHDHRPDHNFRCPRQGGRRGRLARARLDRGDPARTARGRCVVGSSVREIGAEPLAEGGRPGVRGRGQGRLER